MGKSRYSWEYVLVGCGTMALHASSKVVKLAVGAVSRWLALWHMLFFSTHL